MQKNACSVGLSLRKQRLTAIIFCLLSAFTLPVPLQAGVPQQQSTYPVKGLVTDAKGVPLPGVTVRYGITGGVTDNGGRFSLRLPEERGRLTFSCVGYKTVTVGYRAGETLRVRLEESRESLEEVTVVAYGEQRRGQVSGSVATVDAARLQNKPASNVLTLAKGQMAGVYFASQSGDPGGNDVSIIVRGASDLAIAGNRNPLFVIDGVIASDDASLKVGGNPLTSLNPDDIETFTVLKDAAAAAIYGSRAANGEVIITTKKGRYNQHPLLSANVSHTFILQPLLPERIGGNAERRARLEAMKNYAGVYYDRETDSYRYPEGYALGKPYDYFWNEGNGADMTVYQDSLNPFYNNSTDLMAYYLRPAHATNANIQVRGGAEGIAYSVGLGFYDEAGTLRGTGNRRFSAFSNLTFKPAHHLYGNFRFYLAYTDNNRSRKGVDAFNPAPTAYSTLPDFLFTSTVLPGPGTPYFGELTRRYESTREKNDSYKLRTSFDLTYEIADGLALKSGVAVDYLQNNQNVFLPKEVNEYGKTYSSGTIARHLMVLNENLLTYRRTLGGSHHADLLLGFSVQQDEMNNNTGKALGAASNTIHYAPWYSQVYDAEARLDLKDYYSDYEKKTMVGLFGRLNYNYRERYYAGFTLRRDASSTFGEDVRWGWFPSYFVGWTFTEEPFMQALKPWLNYGKLRFSQGRTGRIFEYPYLAQGELDQGAPYLGHPTVVPEWWAGVSNSGLTWEKTTEYDAGLDLGLLDNRIGLTFDYYLKRTRGLLYNPPTPGTHTGFLAPWRNMYGIDNEGVELEVKGELTFNYNIKKKDGLENKETWAPCDPRYIDQLIGGWMRAGKDMVALKRRSPLSVSAMRPIHPLLGGLERDKENITFDRSDRPEWHPVNVRIEGSDRLMTKEEIEAYLQNNNRTLTKRIWIPDNSRATGLFVADMAIDLRALFCVTTNQHEPELSPEMITALEAEGWVKSKNVFGECLVMPKAEREKIIPVLANALINWRITSNQARTFSLMETLALAVSDNANHIAGAIRTKLIEEGDKPKAKLIIDETAGAEVFVTLPCASYVVTVNERATALEEAEKKLTDMMMAFDYENQ